MTRLHKNLIMVLSSALDALKEVIPKLWKRESVPWIGKKNSSIRGNPILYEKNINMKPSGTV
jgi:hypothetical protein